MTAEEELDRLIDAALASYVGEPGAGLERRIVNRVRSRTVLVWAVPLAMAACVWVFVKIPRQTEQGPAPRAVTVRRVDEPASLPVRRIRPRPATLPKLAVFPTPSPLSADERALMAVGAEHPEVTNEGLELRPIEVKPIEILPITTEPIDKGQP